MRSDSVSAVVAPLLPWINGEVEDPDEGLRLLHRFLARAYAVVPESLGGPPWHPTARGVDRLRRDLAAIVRDVLAEPRSRSEPKPLRSLRFGARRFAAAPAKIRTANARRQLDGPSVDLVVRGAAPDLIRWVLLRVLTGPGALRLSLCPAPAPGDPSNLCGRIFISRTERAGRPQVYCTDRCRKRAHRNAYN